MFINVDQHVRSAAPVELIWAVILHLAFYRVLFVEYATKPEVENK